MRISDWSSDVCSSDLALIRDRNGRSLPAWQGCRTLAAGELPLLNPDHPDSLDGRYFGPLPASTVLGRALPILTRDNPAAPLTWRAALSCLSNHPPTRNALPLQHRRTSEERHEGNRSDRTGNIPGW